MPASAVASLLVRMIGIVRRGNFTAGDAIQGERAPPEPEFHTAAAKTEEACQRLYHLLLADSERFPFRAEPVQLRLRLCPAYSETVSGRAVSDARSLKSGSLGGLSVCIRWEGHEAQCTSTGRL